MTRPANLAGPLIEHAGTPVHDMHHRYVGVVQEVSVPAPVSDATHARLIADQWTYSHGWIDRDGRHGPAGAQWFVYGRTKLPDGRIQRHIPIL